MIENSGDTRGRPTVMASVCADDFIEGKADRKALVGNAERLGETIQGRYILAESRFCTVVRPMTHTDEKLRR